MPRLKGMSWERVFTGLGLFFVLLGLAFIVVPLIVKHLPSISLERIPWILLWVYRKDNFWFATSPILIIAGIAYILWTLIRIGALK